eukprot:jgi/Botrbrau1/18145/Bobra.53_1s0016.2
MPGHNSSLFVLGVMILWFGWYGFNPGSQLVLVGGSNAVANAAVTTTLAPAASAMSALVAQGIYTRAKQKVVVYDIMIMGNGALAGLVAITSGCSVVYPWAAIIIGIVAGVLYVVASRISVMLKLDDPLDAIAVHAWNGTWGVIAPGFFAAKTLVFNSYGPNPRAGGPDAPDYFRHYGCFMGGHGYLLGAQLIYAIWVAAWVLANMLPFFWVLKRLNLFRVPQDEEAMGLDISKHGGSAYDHGFEMMDVSKSVHGNGDASTAELSMLKKQMRALEAAFAKVQKEESIHLAPYLKGVENKRATTE